MSEDTSFHPKYGSGQTVSPAVSAVSVSIDPDKNSTSVCLTNLGSNVCYIRIGTGTIEATTADYPIPAGQQIAVSKAGGDNVLSHISADGTTLHIIPGEGF